MIEIRGVALIADPPPPGVRPTPLELRDKELGDLLRWLVAQPAHIRKRLHQEFCEEKPGRNEPCPCGSGKKFKVCCLNPVRQ